MEEERQAAECPPWCTPRLSYKMLLRYQAGMALHTVKNQLASFNGRTCLFTLLEASRGPGSGRHVLSKEEGYL